MPSEESLESLRRERDAYRMLYENAEKRIVRYRDVAARPDIFVSQQNKDFYSDLQTARTAWSDSESGVDFVEWLFAKS